LEGFSSCPDKSGILSVSLLTIFNTDIIFYGICTIILCFLLIGSGIISGAEVAFFSLTPTEKLKCKTSSSIHEVKIYQILESPKELLATILIINNLFNISFITLATYVAWKITDSQTLSGNLITGLIAMITFVIVFFGEVTPKIYANKRNIEVAKSTVKLISFSILLFKPFTFVLITISNLFEKKIEQKSYTLSVDEMNKAIEMSADLNTDENETDILKGIVNFGTISVKQIMTVRPDIIAVERNTSFKDLITQIQHFGYSRLPVYNDTIDKIEGVLHIKDFLPFINYNEFDWQSMIKEIYFIPENKKIDILLKDFQEMHVHMAVVVDEYGGTSGLVTLEDIIEEIVGEINDEFDDEPVMNFKKITDQEYIFEGKISLNDFCKIIDIDAELFDNVKGESESLGGLLLELNAGLPKSGDLLSFDKFDFEIISADTRKINDIKVSIK
jgi:gliding motility-associated protein GldE